MTFPLSAWLCWPQSMRRPSTSARHEVVVPAEHRPHKAMAILAAVQMGWLSADGNPPHSVAITARGIAILVEHGHAPL
jgi:hypothetical protein